MLQCSTATLTNGEVRVERQTHFTSVTTRTASGCSNKKHRLEEWTGIYAVFNGEIPFKNQVSERCVKMLNGIEEGDALYLLQLVKTDATYGLQTKTSS